MISTCKSTETNGELIDENSETTGLIGNIKHSFSHFCVVNLNRDAILIVLFSVKDYFLSWKAMKSEFNWKSKTFFIINW